MTRYRIRISTRAWRELEAASRWWLQHRDKAPGAFEEDVDAALKLLRSNAFMGEPVGASRRQVRRIWLDRIRYFIYYRLLNDDVIEISTIRHGARGSRPRL
ncbi:MAG TPA: type II toxin-antitoxin system RelE/ParE family toxin [Thermoanaerobaculia bacterium]